MLGIVGCALIAMLPLGTGWKFGAGIIWVVSVTRELQLLVQAWRDSRLIRVTPDGSISVLGADSEWCTGRLVSGGVLLARVGWLRLRTGGGPVYSEFVRGDRRMSPDWRRLHVIWRHFGVAD